LNRVTDTCIPEHEAFRRLQKHKNLEDADDKGERYFPHEFMYKMLLSGVLEEYYEIDLKDSWMYAAAEKNLPIIVPGWEDSTMGNIFASYVIKGDLTSTMKSGIEYMVFLSDWYPKIVQTVLVFFSNRWRNSRRFSNMCGAYVVPRMEMHDVPFGVISVKFQIQQLVTVPILEQYQMKKLLGVRYKNIYY
jgi:deoxyhypusine synthase